MRQGKPGESAEVETVPQSLEFECEGMEVADDKFLGLYPLGSEARVMKTNKYTRSQLG